MIKSLINGEEKETVSIYDRGLQYGDGLFETMAVREGRIMLWEAHWRRLTLGCEKLSIALPDKATLEKEIALLSNSQSNDKNATQFVIKLIVTRGAGQRGYLFTNTEKTTRILSVHSWPDYPARYQTQGVVVRYCENTLSENKQLAGIKHLNRLEQILARNEWDTDEFQEGLMLTAQGYVVDGTMSNVFAVKDNEMFTPDLSLAGVAGVMRETVIKIATEAGIPVHEKIMTQRDIEQADELFLSNSLFGIWPIIRISQLQFPQIGDITKWLQEKVNMLGQQ